MSYPKGSFDFCHSIVLNPDISVRVAIYIQTILWMITSSYFPYHGTVFRDASRNTYVLATSLIVASLIQWKTQELSLLDGLIVTNLTAMMTAFVVVNEKYIRTLGLSVTVSSFLFTVFSCYWGIQVWADPVNFGLPMGRSSTDCSASANTSYVVFGQNVSIRNRGLRGFAIFVFGCSAISALSALFHSVLWLLRYTAVGPSAAKYGAASKLARRLHHERAKGASRKAPFTALGGLALVIYMIVSTEQLVARNAVVSSSSRGWSFGQTMGLFVLGQQVMDLLTYLKEELQHRRRNRDRDSGQSA